MQTASVAIGSNSNDDDCSSCVTVTARLARLCKQPGIFNPRYQGYWTSGQRSDNTSCASPWVWKAYPGVSTPVTYQSFRTNEPDCQGDEETCVAISSLPSMDDGCWVDVKCAGLLCPLCELDLWASVAIALWAIYQIFISLRRILQAKEMVSNFHLRPLFFPLFRFIPVPLLALCPHPI